VKIFLSYAHEDSSVAEEIALALRGAGHDVFLDRSVLNPASEYHSRIRRSIKDCDLFLFLISPSSVEPGSYTLTELKIVKAKWPEPWRHVLPVLVRTTPLNAVDRYLTSITLLEPTGNLAAEVATAVEDLQPKPWLYWVAAILAAVVVVVVAAVALWWYFGLDCEQYTCTQGEKTSHNGGTEEELSDIIILRHCA
jgi:hypothetical protein